MLKIKNAKNNPWTTTLGVILIALIPIVVFFGYLTPAQGDELKGYIPQLLEAISDNAWTTIITVLLGIIGIFTKDPKALKK